MSQIDQLSHTLEQIGLSKKEARVYLALLSLGSVTAYRIAEHCDVKKPTVYVILEDLRKKGLVLKVPHAKKALFAARDIEEYLQEREGGLASVRGAIPQFQALGRKVRSNVFFFNSFNGIKQAAEHKYSQMHGKTFHSFYSDLVGADKKLIGFYEIWNKKALVDGISFKILMQKPKDKPHQNDIIKLAETNKNIQIRYVEYEYPSQQSIEIGEDFVRITSEKEMYSTIIDDKNTASAMRQIFEVVWEKGG